MKSSNHSPPGTSDRAPLSDRPASVVRVFTAQPLHTEGELLTLGYAPDGSLWSVEEPGRLLRWDPGTARQNDEFLLDDRSLAWCFDPACRVVAAGAEKLTLWDLTTGQALAGLGPFSWITCLSFSADGTTLATGHDDGSLRLWDVTTRQPLASLRGPHTHVSAVALSPDGKMLASAGEEKLIELWDVPGRSPVRILAGHTDRISALAWHPTLPRLYSAGWDTTVRVWDTETGEPVILLNSHAAQVHALAVSADGALLASADSANQIHLWDLGRHETVRVWPDQGAEVRALAFSPDGRRLARGGGDGVVLVKDLHLDRNGDFPIDGMGLRGGVGVPPDGKRLHAVSPGCSMRSWDVETGAPLPKLKEAGVLRVGALSPDGRRVAGSLALGTKSEKDRPGAQTVPTLFLWDAASGKRVALLDGQAPPITSLAFSPDSKVLASGNYMRSDVWVWSAETGEILLLINGAVEDCSIEAVAIHPNGKWVAAAGIDWMATGGSDGAVALWDFTTGTLVAQFGRGAMALSFHPSGERLATASTGRSVQVWEIPGGKLLAELKEPPEMVSSVAYSPDGKWLACAADDFTLRLWDANTFSLLAVTPLDIIVKSLCFSTDGKSLFTANVNGSSYQLGVARMIAAGA
jgi:WD40 repeat protein